MRYTLALSLLCLFAACGLDNYKQLWNDIEGYAQGERAVENLRTVKYIYRKSLASGDLANQAKAAMMIAHFSGRISTKSEAKEYDVLDSLILLQKGSVKAILLSRKADLLDEYRMEYDHKVDDRAVLEADSSNDIREWDKVRFEKEISAAYLASLKDTTLLQHELLSWYEEILDPEEKNRYLRPTLYDLLAQRALDYFSRDVTDNRFIADPTSFAAAEIFSNAKYTDNNLDIYGKLIRFHQRKNNTDAMVMADLERLEFVYNHTSLLNKEELYEQALEKLRHKYATSSISTLCAYQLADHYHNAAQGITDTTTRKILLTKAMHLCNEGSRVFTSAEGSKNCQSLKALMLHKKLNLTAESVNEPGKPFRLLVNYRNINNIHLRLIRISQSVDFEGYESGNSKAAWERLLSFPVMKSWQQSLRDPLDYTQHTTELKIDALETGKYILIAASDEHFDFNSTYLAAQLIQVSDISYITTDNINYYALHRSTGQPLKGIKFFLQENKNWRSFITDNTGHVNVKYKNDQDTDPSGFWANGKDTLLVDAYFFSGSFDNEVEEEASVNTYYFSDRSIYRPGQTVYFKGIRTKGEGANNKLMPDAMVKVWLNDDNGERVDSLSLRTNAYGSFTGSFKLPLNLTGSFTIGDEENNLYVRVEEYKRPKFEVTFDTVKTTYRVYDSVRITGHAIAFSGNNLSNVKVKWKVLRKPVYSHFMDYLPHTDEEQIAGDKTITDAAGNFQLTFIPTPDKNAGKDLQLMFNYEITADVTDANGETRTGTYQLWAGYHTILLNAVVNEEINLPELKSLHIDSRLANGEFVPLSVKVTLTRLVHPGKLLRHRYWEKPDQFVMNEKEYHQYFPLDVYNNEDNPTTWSKGKVYEQNGVTAENKKWDFSKAGITSGTYELLITDGKELKRKQIITVKDKNRSTDPAYTWYLDHDKSLQPGDVAHVTIGTTSPVYLLSQVEGSVATVRSLTGTLATIDIPIKEADRGNRSVTLAYVKDNRLFSYDITLAVPWSNKELDVSIATHRNKLLPGEKETWNITVKAPAAELMATMYDASLDEISKLDWEVPPFYETLHTSIRWDGGRNFSQASSVNQSVYPIPNIQRYKTFDKLIETKQLERVFTYVENMTFSDVATVKKDTDFKYEEEKSLARLMKPEIKAPPPPPRPRKDFRETVLFIPQLQINGKGSITFTMPEALTRWKFLAFAHTKDLKFGMASSEVITQKPLMVVPNAPRFLREGDNVKLSARISNVTDAQLIGKAKLELLDPDSKKPIDGWFVNISPVQPFTAVANQSTQVSFQFIVPQGYTKQLIYRITAESGKFTDGEEALLPVLPNRIMVTESMPIYIRGNGKKNYTFDKLLHSNNSSTLQHQAVTVTYNSNPIWYAVQSLPYLMEFPHECAEQTFSRYYANVVATHILKSVPKIHEVIKRWATEPNNDELKSALLEETPWVKEIKAENHLAMLMDLQKMSLETEKAYKQLEAMQLPNGAFPWFGGMEANDYITQHILTGLGRLRMMKIPIPDGIVKKGMDYLDKRPRGTMFNMLDLDYLYMRSYFPEYPLNEFVKTQLSKAEKNWKKQSIYGKGMTALVLHRFGKTANSIMQDLKENATQSEEMGMYWTSVEAGYYWYEAPIETQSLLIEAFATITKDQPTVDALKTWLLRQKQTNSWSTTRSTADACYALLMNGTNWLNATPEVKITIGAETITAKEGILKTRFEGKKVSTNMAKVALNVTGNGSQPSWGSVYWQYFEQLDKITPSKSGLSVQRELYLQKNGTLSRITATQPLHVGDKVTMRLIVKADRDMEFVHLKDMRPACLEPVNVLSGYRNGYYESTKDLATHFFFDRIKKGVQILEYPLFVSHIGRYAGGISTLQCMYAPEFNANSAGMNVVVE